MKRDVKFTVVCFVLWSVAGPHVAFADGMPVERGRFIGGPVTVLKLTPQQVRVLNAAEAQNQPKVLLLSEKQRVQIQRDAGLAPLQLHVYNTRKGENDCCCEASNRGLWFADNKLEVPHAYLHAEGNPPVLPQTDAGLPAVVVIASAAALLVVVALLLRYRSSARSQRP